MGWVEDWDWSVSHEGRVVVVDMCNEEERSGAGEDGKAWTETETRTETIQVYLM